MSDATRRVLLLGGTSEIGLAIVRRLASDGPTRAYLLGRDRARLEQAAAELDREGCPDAVVDVLDADYIADHGEVVERAFAQAGGFDVVVLAVGVLGAQAGLDANPSEAFEVMRVNFVGSGSLLLSCLRDMRERGEGTLVALSTAAVERLGPRTRFTERRRRGSMRSPRASPTRARRAACACLSSGRGS